MNRILSMTGFAQVATAAAIFTLKSHNHRFLELHLAAPPMLGPVERDIRILLGGSIHRGKVHFSIALRPDAPEFRPRLNAAWLKDLQGQWGALFPEAPQLPDALLQAETAFLPPEGPDETWKGEILAGTRSVLQGFLYSRAEEGEKLVPSMLEACRDIQAILAAFEPRLAGIRRDITDRLRGQLTVLMEDRAFDPQRIEQEAAVLCVRMDPEEELVRASQFAARLEEHLSHPPAPAGKMLDFLVQELSRELQTLSQKVKDLPLREETVKMKMLCERLREQVQNIE